MRVKAVFHGILSDWVGVPQAEFNLPEGGTWADLLCAIKKTYGPHLPTQLRDKDQEAFNQALWARRGRERLNQLHIKLNDGEEVHFFLPLAGG